MAAMLGGAGRQLLRKNVAKKALARCQNRSVFDACNVAALFSGKRRFADGYPR
jgi:hypothetical protein